MLGNLLNQENYRSYNVTVASLFGLQQAVYYELLISIYNKAISKNKTDNEGYFKVDRKYVTEQTTLTKEEQLKFDTKFSEIAIINKKDKDLLKLDLQLFASIIANDKIELVEDISNVVKSKTKKAKEDKKTAIINNLKNSISYSNNEIVQAMCGWIDSVYSSGKAMSKETIRIFEEKLDKYTGRDLEMALDIIEIATLHCYIDVQWAIAIYEKDTMTKRNQQLYTNQRVNRVTEQVRTTSISNDEVF